MSCRILSFLRAPRWKLVLRTRQPSNAHRWECIPSTTCQILGKQVHASVLTLVHDARHEVLTCTETSSPPVSERANKHGNKTCRFFLTPCRTLEPVAPMLKSCWKSTNELKLVEAMSNSKQYREARVHVASQIFVSSDRSTKNSTQYLVRALVFGWRCECVVREFKDTSESSDRFTRHPRHFTSCPTQEWLLKCSRCFERRCSVKRIVGSCRCDAVSLNPFGPFFGSNLCVCCPFVIHGHVDGDNTTLGSRVFFNWTLLRGTFNVQHKEVRIWQRVQRNH